MEATTPRRRALRVLGLVSLPNDGKRRPNEQRRIIVEACRLAQADLVEMVDDLPPTWPNIGRQAFARAMDLADESKIDVLLTASEDPWFRSEEAKAAFKQRMFERAVRVLTVE